MITNEYGIHTFSLKLQCKYSEIQNIIEQNECIRTGKGKLGLSSYYQMPQFKDIGVEIQLGQSVSHPCWLILIVNPSSLLAGTYELEKRHHIVIDDHILRLELRFGRSKITKLTKSKDWESQLVELGSQIEKQQHKFLHRLHMTHFDPISLPELLNCINASKYREKTKRKLRRIAKKANGCVSLAAVQKDCRIKKSDFIKLLGKFEEMGRGIISY